jgi:hypothetical protein
MPLEMGHRGSLQSYLMVLPFLLELELRCLNGYFAIAFARRCGNSANPDHEHCGRREICLSMPCMVYLKMLISPNYSTSKSEVFIEVEATISRNVLPLCIFQQHGASDGHGYPQQ